MPKPQIVGSIQSTYTRAVCMVCEEKGIDYVLSETTLGSPALRAIHPFGKMPVLRHGDVELFELKAIATYLDRSFPGPNIFPSDPHLLALTEQWVSLVNTMIDRTLIRTYLYAYIGPKPPRAEGLPGRDRSSHARGARANRSSRQGSRQEPAFGRRSLHLRRHQPAADPLSPAASAGRCRGSRGGQAPAGYYDRHAARPSFQTTIPPAGPPRRVTPA